MTLDRRVTAGAGLVNNRNTFPTARVGVGLEVQGQGAGQ